MSERRKGFMMYSDYREYFDLLEDEEIGAVMRQFFRFASGDSADVSGFTQSMQFLYTIMKRKYEQDTVSYNKMCESRAAAAKQRGQRKQEAEPESKPSYDIRSIEDRTYNKYRNL